MIWLVVAGSAALGVVYLVSLFMKGEIRKLVRALRWIVGAGLMAGAAWTGARGQMFIASLLGAGGLGVLMRGRLGPFDFGSGLSSSDNTSAVSSNHLDMRLEHESGRVSGTVKAGHFAGRELEDLAAAECWALYDEVSDDPDSLALFESWLDANRSGWREYFAAEFGMDMGEEDEPRRSDATSAISGLDEAYDTLGLKPGATPEDIKAAHRKLMKSVHPDAGGSAFLAARINQAKDMLLKHAQRRV